MNIRQPAEVVAIRETEFASEALTVSIPIISILEPPNASDGWGTIWVHIDRVLPSDWVITKSRVVGVFMWKTRIVPLEERV
jgi:hypothetical protein